MDQNNSSNNIYRQLLDASAMNPQLQSAESEDQPMTPRRNRPEAHQSIPQRASQVQRRGHNSQLYRYEPYQQQGLGQHQRQSHEQRHGQHQLQLQLQHQHQQIHQQQHQHQEVPRLPQRHLPNEQQLQHYQLYLEDLNQRRLNRERLRQQETMNREQSEQESHHLEQIRLRGEHQERLRRQRLDQEQRHRQLQLQLQHQHEHQHQHQHHHHHPQIYQQHQAQYEQPTHTQQHQQPVYPFVNSYLQNEAPIHQQMGHFQPLRGGPVEPQHQHEQPRFGFPLQQAAYGNPYGMEQRPRPDEMPRRQGQGFGPAAPQHPPSPAGSDFDRMSTDQLKQWCKEHSLPHSHYRAQLLEQAKTGMHITTIRRGKKEKGKYQRFPIVIDSEPELETFTEEFPNNGPGLQDPADYLYSPPGESSPPPPPPTPVAEEESVINEGQVIQEDEYPGEPASVDDAGQSDGTGTMTRPPRTRRRTM